MRERDFRDIITGVLLIAVGLFATAYVTATLEMGTTTRMGPGMFPAVLGVIIAAFGVAVLVPALFRPGEMPSVNVKPLLMILLSILVFGLMIRPFGVVPSVIALTLISSRADPRLSLRGGIVLAVILASAATLLFPIGLGLLIPIVAWPW